MRHSDFESLPHLGAGIGLRKQHFRELTHADAGPLQWLEIVPENFMAFGGFAEKMLDYCAGRWPIVSHGVNLSIGSCDPLNEDYVARLKALLERTRALWYSDHLCFTSVGGEYFHDLIALPFSREAADHVIARVGQLKQRIALPFLLENPSYYVAMPGAEMEEADFITRVLEGADCGMLLDVNNVYVNSRNHGYDAKAFIRRLPLHRVAQIHMAGHKETGDVVIDTHEGPIINPVWDLYDFTLREIGRPVSTLIEWDTNVPPLARVLEESTHAQKIIDRLPTKPLVRFATNDLPRLAPGDLALERPGLPSRPRLAERREGVVRA